TQTASSNSTNATSSTVNIHGDGDVGVFDSTVKSSAKADLQVTQEAGQSNENLQNPREGVEQGAGSDDGDITQTQSLGTQANGSTQTASSNSTNATSSTVSVSAGGGVTIADSDIESIAEAGSYIGQLASQSNAADQNQEANSDGGDITQDQSLGTQAN